MAKPETAAAREHRISMEIVVDAYNEEECAMAWHCYLDDHLGFPFEARVRHTMTANWLRVFRDRRICLPATPMLGF
jgi:hypothetical protein